MAPAINLDSNGLRQGCILSPILYLLIINALVSKPPGYSMPSWDQGFVLSAFTHGVQTLESRTDLGKWLVFLFVDDTAFVTDNELALQALLDCYHSFTVTWRIRVNPSKCKVLRNKNCGVTVNEPMIGDSVVKTVQFLKYLGYWLGVNGRVKNDEHIKAQATQLRFKLRTLRKVLGEHMTMGYFNTYATHSVIYGSDLGDHDLTS